jgi:hypothetical protein
MFPPFPGIDGHRQQPTPSESIIKLADQIADGLIPTKKPPGLIGTECSQPRIRADLGTGRLTAGQLRGDPFLPSIDLAQVTRAVMHLPGQYRQ